MTIWSNGTKYKIGDVVYYGFDYYKCILNHTAQLNWAPSIHTQALWVVQPKVNIELLKNISFDLTVSPAGDDIDIINLQITKYS